MKKQKGFSLIEVLILILILSVVFVAFIGVISQALNVSSRAQHQTEAVTYYENLLFDLENGLRADLVNFGGRGELGSGYKFEISGEKSLKSYSYLKSKLTWNSKGYLDFDLVMPEGGIR